MPKSIKAALGYWAFVFGLGFLLGTARTFWLQPLLKSEIAAVVIELPLMLAASWMAARFFIRRLALAKIADGLVMGAVAFALLLAAEAYLSIALIGGSTAEWLNGLFYGAGLIGLCGQLAFAVFPAMQLRSAVGKAR